MDESQGFGAYRVGGRTWPTWCFRSRASCAAPGDASSPCGTSQVPVSHGFAGRTGSALGCRTEGSFGTLYGSKRTGDVGLTGLLGLAAQTLMDIMSVASTGKTGPLSTLLVPVHSGSRPPAVAQTLG